MAARTEELSRESSGCARPRRARVRGGHGHRDAVAFFCRRAPQRPFLFRLDQRRRGSDRTMLKGEWWRTVTALCLQRAAHIFSAISVSVCLPDAPVASDWRWCRRSRNDHRRYCGQCPECSCVIAGAHVDWRLDRDIAGIGLLAVLRQMRRGYHAFTAFRNWVPVEAEWRCWHSLVSAGKIPTSLPMCWALAQALPPVYCSQGGTATGPFTGACSGHARASLVQS